MEQKKETIQEGKKVRVAYTVTVDGQTAESTEGKPPLYYIHGGKGILPSLQKRLEGLTEGESIEFDLPPEEAYGPWREEAVVPVPLSEMPDKPLRPGMTLQEELPEGGIRIGRVQEIREDAVVMNFNHPMAGKVLHYRMQVISVMS